MTIRLALGDTRRFLRECSTRLHCPIRDSKSLFQHTIALCVAIYAFGGCIRAVCLGTIGWLGGLSLLHAIDLELGRYLDYLPFEVCYMVALFSHILVGIRTCSWMLLRMLAPQMGRWRLEDVKVVFVADAIEVVVIHCGARIMMDGYALPVEVWLITTVAIVVVFLSTKTWRVANEVLPSTFVKRNKLFGLVALLVLAIGGCCFGVLFVGLLLVFG